MNSLRSSVQMSSDFTIGQRLIPSACSITNTELFLAANCFRRFISVFIVEIHSSYLKASFIHLTG